MELENALVDIAVQESLSTHRTDSSPERPSRSSEFVDYERYGSGLIPNEDIYQEKIARQSIQSEYSIQHESNPTSPDPIQRSRHRPDPEYSVRISTRRFDDYDTDQSVDTYDISNKFDDRTEDNSMSEVSPVRSLDNRSESSMNNNSPNENFSKDENHSKDENLSDLDLDITYHSRINIVVGRGRKSLQGGKNFPLNPVMEVGSYIMYVDQGEAADPDVIMKIEDLDFNDLGLDETIDDIRIYFDWSSFYCTAMPNITNIMNRIKKGIHRSVKVYVPLYAEDKTLPGDVKRLVLGSPDNTGDIRLMLVYGAYPLFDWHEASRLDDLKQSVNPEMYLMISNHDS
jgi:hypothetical protein